MVVFEQSYCIDVKPNIDFAQFLLILNAKVFQILEVELCHKSKAYFIEQNAIGLKFVLSAAINFHDES